MRHKHSNFVGGFSVMMVVGIVTLLFHGFTYFTATGSKLSTNHPNLWIQMFVSEKANLPPVPEPIAFDIAIDPTDSANLYLAVDFPASAIYSEDYGMTWITQTTGLPVSVSGTRLAIDPVSPQRIFLGLQNGSIYRSDDGGNSWVEKYSTGVSPISALAVHPITPTIVFAGSVVGTYIYRSADGGDVWTPIALTEPSNHEVTQILVDAGNPDKIYTALKYEGLFVSLDAGVTWENSGIYADWIAIDPVDPATMYRVDCDLYKSEDGGDWIKLTTPSPCYERVYINPSDRNTLYLTSQYRYATRSVDGGNSWKLLDKLLNGFLSARSVPFAIDPVDNDRIYVYAYNTASGAEWDLFVLSGYSLFLPLIQR